MNYKKLLTLLLAVLLLVSAPMMISCGGTTVPTGADVQDPVKETTKSAETPPAGQQTDAPEKTSTPTQPPAASDSSESIEPGGGEDEVRTYTLEAEHTFLEGKTGCGYSGNTTGTGMITGDDTDSRNASNGFYVSWLYYHGAYLEFEFEAEEDIDDLKIVFRLSAQFNSIDVKGDQVFVGINYDDATGGYEQAFEFPFAIESYSELSSKVKDFSDFVVAEGVSLKKGTNIIELVINNDIKGVGGTMYAAAPLVDCMILYTKGTVRPVIYNPEYTQ